MYTHIYIHGEDEAQDRQSVATMRPKKAKTRAKMAKTRPKMAKMRPTIAKMRPQMAKMRSKMMPSWVPRTRCGAALRIRPPNTTKSKNQKRIDIVHQVVDQVIKNVKNGVLPLPPKLLFMPHLKIKLLVIIQVHLPLAEVR